MNNNTWEVGLKKEENKKKTQKENGKIQQNKKKMVGFCI